MMKNEGTIDRVLRVILGIALIGAYFLYPDLPYRWVLWIGIVPLVTGLVGWCPLYSVLGIRTCKAKTS
ncbi:MAG: DUF2892 domain-containing protein [Alphaproteobacteria bacterium]|nr:MAG: DUF2892 domain-containing protein [Alphaproteobacteria bacterium]